MLADAAAAKNTKQCAAALREARVIGDPWHIAVSLLRISNFDKSTDATKVRGSGGFAVPSSYAIGEHFEEFIKQQVEGGRYASASEVVRDALRLLEQEEQRRVAALNVLRDEIKKGLASGRGKSAEEVLGRLERKYASLGQARRGK